MLINVSHVQQGTIVLKEQSPILISHAQKALIAQREQAGRRNSFVLQAHSVTQLMAKKNLIVLHALKACIVRKQVEKFQMVHAMQGGFVLEALNPSSQLIITTIPQEHVFALQTQQVNWAHDY